MRLLMSVCMLICSLFPAEGDSLGSTPLEQQDVDRRLENLEQVYPKCLVEPISDTAKMEIDYYELDEKPKPIHWPKPDFKGIGCPHRPVSVVIEALVDTSGDVADAKILLSSGNEALDSAILEASLKVKFTPPRHRGKSVRVRVTIPYTLEVTNALQ